MTDVSIFLILASLVIVILGVAKHTLFPSKPKTYVMKNGKVKDD